MENSQTKQIPQSRVRQLENNPDFIHGAMNLIDELADILRNEHDTEYLITNLFEGYVQTAEFSASSGKAELIERVRNIRTAFLEIEYFFSEYKLGNWDSSTYSNLNPIK